jgi:type I site-specific restriction endonuclease
MNKKGLSERDICTKFITPALQTAGWDIDLQVREEVSFTDGRIYVRGKIHARGAQKRASLSVILCSRHKIILPRRKYADEEEVSRSGSACYPQRTH